MSETPVTSPNRPLVIGGVLLLAGFGAGFFAGRESLRQAVPGSVPGTVAHAPADPHAGHDHAAPDGSLPAGTMPARASGHTFTGEINAPPHGAEGHELAQSLLAGATCPCGGCQGMMLLACGCDVSREVEGLAAHLLERGKAGPEVLAQLSEHFGLVAGGMRAAPATGVPPDGLDGLADAFRRGSGVRGPAEVPSSARRTSPSP